MLGSFSMFFEVGVGAGGLALGALADRSGERAAFGLGGLVTAAGLVLLTSVLRHPAHRSSTAPA